MKLREVGSSRNWKTVYGNKKKLERGKLWRTLKGLGLDWRRSLTNRKTFNKRWKTGKRHFLLLIQSTLKKFSQREQLSNNRLMIHGDQRSRSWLIHLKNLSLNYPHWLLTMNSTYQHHNISLERKNLSPCIVSTSNRFPAEILLKRLSWVKIFRERNTLMIFTLLKDSVR